MRTLLVGIGAAVVGMVAMSVPGGRAAVAASPQTAGSRPAVAVPAATPPPRTDAARPSPALAVAAAHDVSLAGPQQSEMVRQYCAGCHSDRAKAGSLSLQGWNAEVADRDRVTTEKIIRKLRAGMMPPAGARRPDDAQLLRLASSLETRMDQLSAASPDPGWRPFQRLNRAEYTRSVKQLVGLDLDVTAFLPADTISDGFDNVADVQAFSPTLMEGYLRAASRVATLAIGDPQSAATQATYTLPKTASQLERADGAPLGTRGGLSVLHTFPADGDYVFSMDFYAEPLGLLYGSTSANEQIEVSVDGARVGIFAIDPRMSEEKTGLTMKSAPVHVRAGAHRVSAAFLQKSDGLINDLIAPIDHTMADTEIGTAYGITTLPHLRSLSVVGPHRVTGVSETPTRRQIFTCRPTSTADEVTCASSIVRRLATQAFRRPVSERDFTKLMQFYERGRASRDFEYGITKALEAVLVSPQFLLRTEEMPARVAGESYRLGDYALASRLSFFVWGSGPDEALLKAAGAGRLSAPGGLRAQMTRMLADPKADALSTRFASQWLRLQDLEGTTPDPILYPYADQTLTRALQRETELFFDALVREDRSVLDLLTADFTYVNDRVARHYGLPNVSGQHFRRVTLPPTRRGILGHGSVLMLTSIADRTSPVMRGKWVMEVLLGTPPPPPPPNVPALDETSGTGAAGQTLSVRQRMEQHRSNPTWLALENFDATGKYRVKDGGAQVDTAGTLYDGTPIDGPDSLRQAVLRRKDVFLTSFTESLLTYALGRRVEPTDMPLVRRILRDAARRDYRLSAFVQGVIDSAAFQRVRVPGDMPAPATTTMPQGVAR
jgi:mono/diheme cytochrome c family protein